ncbi:DUF1127 domain-containing protein [Pseudogemmobacter faecipullorum]|uniref:DUF1127 domain-containing protein n=1 Tax=Pseudogemmobacter faecipullorum TaxID=2755041 RepID=A0ABS8CJ10_9RHOB|nr:DUF1127 domain-containing protein [Pseudogemmobacter faecipullorum]MCB5409346.1 DUF1127 domain-containing protein [Pseudogemmobacter faecipullorum]
MAQLKGSSLPALPALPVQGPLTARLLIGLAMQITRFDERRRSRRALSRLDDYMLRDIGISHAAREAEIARPFWRA